LLQHSLRPYFKITKIEYDNEIIKQFSPLIENISYISDSEKFCLFALLDAEKLIKAKYTDIIIHVEDENKQKFLYPIKLDKG